MKCSCQVRSGESVFASGGEQGGSQGGKECAAQVTGPQLTREQGSKHKA